MAYRNVYAAWQKDPEGFWMEAAEAIDWDRKPTKALFDENAPIYEWFSDGLANTCYNAVDRHVENGRANQTAIIYDSPVTGTKEKITYRALQDKVACLAGALSAKGVGKGDRVIIYMPMVPEALVAMLAVTRIGAIHSVVFGGFAANELAVRIDDATPKAVIAGSCGIEPGRIVPYKPLLDGAIEMASHKPEFCIIFQREQQPAELTPGRDFDWNEVQQGVSPAACVPVEGNHPVYVLYTSGTTGQPKGVIRHTGGHLVALNWTMKAIYGMEPGIRRGLGRGPQLYLLRPADPRQHHGGVRRQARGHPRCRHLLADDRGIPDQGALYRPHRVPRHQERGSSGRHGEEIRSLVAANPVSRG